jgi:hypothetical protein
MVVTLKGAIQDYPIKTYVGVVTGAGPDRCTIIPINGSPQIDITDKNDHTVDASNGERESIIERDREDELL